MKKFLFCTIMASLLALTGCQKEELVNDNNTPGGGEKVILTANIQGAAQTRVTLTPVTENGTTIVKVAWNESGEKFKVYGLDENGWPNSSSLAWFTQKEGTNQFMGTLPSTNNGTYCAFYGDDEEGSNVFQFFLDEQDGTLYQRDENYSTVLMGAEFSSFSEPITFKQMTAILKPTFKVGDADIDNTITKIVMGNVILPTTAGASEEIIIAPTSSATALADDIYIHLPIINMLDGEFSNMHDGKYLAGHEFTFTVTAGGKDYTGSLTIPTGMSIEEGKFYTATIALEEKIPYLTFTVGGEQSLVLNVMGEMDQSIEYSADGGDWGKFEISGNVDEYGMTTTTPVPFTNNLRMRGKSASGTVDFETPKGFMISFTNDNIPVTCSGDIRTLVDYTNYETTSTANACFSSLFMNCSALAYASELKLISNNNKMAASCYGYMFAGCSELISAPALPATTLAESCYERMFSGCTRLTSAPELPAEELAVHCYAGMFNTCTSLESAPALPATTLAQSCYLNMFSGCSNLTTAPALPATTLAQSCYLNMFSGCSNLTTAPALPATTLAASCYSNMFASCSKLISAPVLPAETLVTGCYWQMFSGCTNLNSVTMLATNIEATSCLTNWMSGVAAAGTFTKAASLEQGTESGKIPTGVSGIPSDWTVKNYGE